MILGTLTRIVLHTPRGVLQVACLPRVNRDTRPLCTRLFFCQLNGLPNIPHGRGTIRQ
jgi:hypothetical protein